LIVWTLLDPQKARRRFWWRSVMIKHASSHAYRIEHR
jgi:hypothetical protein